VEVEDEGPLSGEKLRRKQLNVASLLVSHLQKHTISHLKWHSRDPTVPDDNYDEDEALLPEDLSDELRALVLAGDALYDKVVSLEIQEKEEEDLKNATKKCQACITRVPLCEVPHDYKDFKIKKLYNEVLQFYSDVVLEVVDRFSSFLLLLTELTGGIFDVSLAAICITFFSRILVACKLWKRVEDGMRDETSKWGWTGADANQKDKNLVYKPEFDKRGEFLYGAVAFTFLPAYGMPILQACLRSSDAGAYGWKRLESATNATNDAAMATGDIVEAATKLMTENLLAFCVEIAAVINDTSLIKSAAWLLSFGMSCLHIARLVTELQFDVRYRDALKQKGMDADVQFEKNTADDKLLGDWARKAGPLARRVTMSYCDKLTGKGFAALALSCSGLTEVYASFTKMDDSAVRLLFEHNPGIREIWVDSCPVSEELVEELRSQGVTVSAN